MKSVKGLLAFALVAGAGVTQAATVATFNITQTGSSIYTANTFTGTAILDSAGTLTETLVGNMNASLDGIALGTVRLTSTNVYTGTISAAGVFTPTSGQFSFQSCTNVTGTLCSFTPAILNVAIPFSTVGGSLSKTGGGTLTSAFVMNEFNFTLGFSDVLKPVAAPAVPVPAAAWLFGSGLLGLAGVSRRRSKKD